MILLITRKQKLEFAKKIIKSYEQIYIDVGRRLSTHKKLEYTTRVYKMLNIKRKGSNYDYQ